MEKNNKPISQAVIRRLPRYYRHLGELLEHGITRISSGELSQQMGITASQIRQDLNNFGGFGQQGYGYQVEYLHTVMGEILGLTRQYSMIIIGAGHLGMALANYANFEKRGFQVQALFDVNPDVIGTRVNGHDVYSMDSLETYIKNNNIDIAALAIPKIHAKKAAQDLVDYGIKAIWNFASVDLDFPQGQVIVENVHLSDSLMTLAYRLKD